MSRSTAQSPPTVTVASRPRHSFLTSCHHLVVQQCSQWLQLLCHSIVRRLLRDAREELLVAHDAELCHHAIVSMLGSMLLHANPQRRPQDRRGLFKFCSRARGAQHGHFSAVSFCTEAEVPPANHFRHFPRFHLFRNCIKPANTGKQS